MSRFIVIEGCDNTGKSTLAKLVALRMVAQGRGVKTIGFPSPGPIGHLIRSSLQGERKITPRARAHLFQADIVDRQPWIEEQLGSGHHVICDRYYFSTLVYQREVLDDLALRDIVFAAPMRHPDHLVLLDAAPEVLIERGRRRQKYVDAVFEREDLEYVTRLRDRYRALINCVRCERPPYRPRVLDATRPQEELEGAILRLFEPEEKAA